MTLNELIEALKEAEADANMLNQTSHPSHTWEVVIDSVKAASPRSIQQVVFDEEARLITIVHKYESNAAKRA